MYCFGQTERDYEEYIAKQINGKTEVSVYSGRVDIVTEEYAIEVEKASEWKESIGQALWYGMQTNKKPGIILLILEPEDRKYGVMLISCLQHAGLKSKIKVWFFPENFE
jgi:hypothetical protein